MNPRFAALLTWGFVFYMFRRDIREVRNVSSAIWLPTAWLLIIMTRAVTTWISMFGLGIGGSSLEEGSFIDAVVFFGLIAAGMRVLGRRQISVNLLTRYNVWLTIYLAYCFIAIAWSDFPFVALKRWLKNLGHPVMVLILLTENDPIEAVTRVLKRCTYVVAPVSILFIKYFPEWGRGFSNWTGAAYNTGITENKNSLGWDCLILGFFFVWHLFRTLGQEKGRERRDELLQCIGFLWMIGWLFMISDSKTPLISVFLAITIFIVSCFRRVNKAYIGVYVISIALILFVSEGIFHFYEPLLEMMGRNASLTERKPLWEELLRWGAQNPVLGTGFESFWLGDRRETIWDTMKWAPSQAHNGYLETYINTGLVGLCLLLCLLAATYRKALKSMVRGDSLGQFRFPFFFAIVAYNWTEASMYGLHPIFFMLFLVTMDLPGSRATVPAVDSSTDTDRTYYAAT